MAKKRGLGRGLSALIPDDIEEEIKEEVVINTGITNIDTNLIEPNENQPRRDFDNNLLKEMSDSIQKHGIIQPIVVRKAGSGYQIIAGERRWRAAQLIGLSEVPCIIKEVENIESAELALIENIQREDLNPIEEALAYDSLINQYNLTQEEVSNVVGKSRPYITNIIRLLNLDERIIEFIANKKISAGHGRTLLQIENKDKQYEVAKIIIEQGLSVRGTEKLVKDLNKESNKKKPKDNKQKDSNIVEIEDSLRRLFGTKVEINKGKSKGKIEIEYYNDEDLERILELLTK